MAGYGSTNPGTARPFDPPGAQESLASVADRLAALLLGVPAGVPADPADSDLVFEEDLQVRALTAARSAPEVWAVDGGQGVAADARCLKVVLTRACRVAYRHGRSHVEDEGPLSTWLLGAGDEHVGLTQMGLGVRADAAIDVNLLRDAGEWVAVRRCVEEAEPGAVVLVDGDLRADRRIPSATVGAIVDTAASRGVHLAAVTKHSSLSRDGVPLVGHLEALGLEALGPRARWWAPVARGAESLGYAMQVTVARLDPDARFAFRVDVAGDDDPAEVLGLVAASCDDAAFCGYPYPLAVADRLAACPRWLCHDVALEVEDHLDRAGVDPGVRERAFADRHGFLERA